MLALLGPSGSGKTTTLRLLAGFESPDAGRVLVDGEDVTGLEPVARRFGMVFQHYALFPHLDVGDNVAFGLESLGVRGAELDRRVAEALALVDLAGFERRRIGQLSGGQQQRVALARALAPEPKVLLLDEPLSNLDPSLRERTRHELRELIRRLGITTVLVTHEQEEAFDLGDRVAVLRQGRLEQVGTPDELYAEPANLFVGGFVGRSSVVPAMVLGPADSGDGVRVAIEGVEWHLESVGCPAAGPAELLVRPEALRFAPEGRGGTARDGPGQPLRGTRGALHDRDRCGGHDRGDGADPLGRGRWPLGDHAQPADRRAGFISTRRARDPGTRGEGHRRPASGPAAVAGGLSAGAGAARRGPRARRLDPGARAGVPGQADRVAGPVGQPVDLARERGARGRGRHPAGGTLLPLRPPGRASPRRTGGAARRAAAAGRGDRIPVPLW